jgi:hypothetical protein
MANGGVDLSRFKAMEKCFGRRVEGENRELDPGMPRQRRGDVGGVVGLIRFGTVKYR